MLVVRCIHCANYNGEHCKKCLESTLSYTAYRERTAADSPDIHYEDIIKKKVSEKTCIAI